MNLNDYQKEAVKFAAYSRLTSVDVQDSTTKIIHPVALYPFLGLGEEAGEVLGKMAKAVRDGSDLNTLRVNVAKELGDVLWNLAACAEELGINLDDIATLNLAKLDSRKQRGVISGKGDDR